MARHPITGERRTHGGSSASRAADMITPRFRWQNFRGFKDTGLLQLRPITILIGANNSGKTSVLAPWLLIKQTLENRDASSALVSRGDLINAGTYPDFVHRHDIRLPITLYFAFHQHDPTELTEEPADVGVYPPGSVNLTFAYRPRTADVALSRFTIDDSLNRPFVVRTRSADGHYTLRLFDKGVVKTRHPSAIETAVRTAINDSQPRGCVFTSTSVIRAALDAATSRPSDSDAPKDLELSPYSTSYLRAIDFTADELRLSAEQLHFVGPLREPPRRAYEMSGAEPADVGVRGQFAAELLFRHRNGALMQAVNDWLARFGYDRGVCVLPLLQDAFALMVGRSPADKSAVNIADSGFGLSQVLPLLVQGLHSAEQSVLVSEQPEIHLNPRLQTVLADFFCALAGSGKRVLVETHSEHLLLRIRRLVADGQIRADQVAIYYVERANGAAHARLVPLQDNGHVDPGDWPRGFFEDSLREALALATAQSRLSVRA